MPGGPKRCELFLILYSTAFSTDLKVNKTDVVTVCLFRILTFEQIFLNPVKPFGLIFKNKNDSSQPKTAAGHYAEIVTGHYFRTEPSQAVSSRATLN